MTNAVTDPIDNLLSLTSVTVLNATAALERGTAALKAGQTVFDLRNVLTVDSVAVSVMLAWQRAAQESGVALELKNLPPALQSLTRLYGVCALLFPPDAQQQDGCTASIAAPDGVETVQAPTAVIASKTGLGNDPAAHHHH